MFLFNIFSLLAAVLFVLLSPGVLLTLPPGPGGIFLSGETSLLAALIHAVVYVVLLQLVNMGVTRLMIQRAMHENAAKVAATTKKN